MSNVVLLGLVSLFTDISTEMIYPILPLYLSTVMGAGFLWEGLGPSAPFLFGGTLAFITSAAVFVILNRKVRDVGPE